jgi:hypothetical protein
LTHWYTAESQVAVRDIYTDDVLAQLRDLLGELLEFSVEEVALFSLLLFCDKLVLVTIIVSTTSVTRLIKVCI